MIRPLTRRRRGARLAAALTAVALTAAALALTGCSGRATPEVDITNAGGGETTAPQPSGSPQPPPFDGWSDPTAVGRPYPKATVTGLLNFRGNLTRTWYGTGPVPRTKPVEAWTFPKSGGLCGNSTDESGTREWCGSGWTGQPAVFERDGRTWVVFGAYDYAVHFLDASTGQRIINDFKTADIIKGSVTADPDGFPLIYTGSRDNYFRILSYDQGKPVEMWKMSAYDVSPRLWNDDWDGNALIIDDYLFEGGENSQWYVVKLNRGYDGAGQVTVKPQVVFHAPGWDDQQLRDFGSTQVSIENSVAIYKNTVYFANSGGLVQGWDISGVKEGKAPTRVFRFWTGDDTDASIVIDEDGFLYVGSEWEKHNARSREIGQMMKLDPSRPDSPLVWSVKDQGQSKAGVWGTPALYKDIVIFDTNGGDVLAIDRQSGAVRWRFHTPGGETWQSPVVVDDVLILGDCDGVLHAFDVADTHAAPIELWNMKIGGCIEATPAVWKGRLYFATRAGAFHALTAA